jgi:hypothetical protein
MNLDTFCRMCGGLQYLNQQLLQRAQDAKVILFSIRECGLGFFNDDGFDVAAEDRVTDVVRSLHPQAAVRRVCISFATVLALACGDGTLTPAAGVCVFVCLSMLPCGCGQSRLLPCCRGCPCKQRRLEGCRLRSGACEKSLVFPILGSITLFAGAVRV